MSGRNGSDEAGKIFVGGIARDVDEGILTSYFSQFGEVVLANVMRDKFGISRGFGFVAFDPPENANEVLRRVHVIEGRTIEIKQAVKHDRVYARGGQTSSGPGGSNAPLPPPDKDGVIYVPRQVYVGGLPYNISEGEVREYFEKFGPVVSANLKYDFGQNPPKFRGFGFINFVEDESVEKALENYSNHQLGGKWIEVKRSKYSHVVQGENSGVIMPQMAQGSGSGRGGAYDGGRAAPAYKDPYGGMASTPATRDPYGGGGSMGSGPASRDPYGGGQSRYGGYQSSGPVGRSSGSSYRSSPYGTGPSAPAPSNISYEARPLPRQTGASAGTMPPAQSHSTRPTFDPYMSGTSAYPPKSGGWRSQQSINPPM